MSTVTKNVRGRKSKQEAMGYLVRTSPADRLAFDLADLRELRRHIDGLIKQEMGVITTSQKNVEAARKNADDLDREIAEVEKAIEILQNQ